MRIQAVSKMLAEMLKRRLDAVPALPQLSALAPSAHSATEQAGVGSCVKRYGNYSAWHAALKWEQTAFRKRLWVMKSAEKKFGAVHDGMTQSLSVCYVIGPVDWRPGLMNLKQYSAPLIKVNGTLDWDLSINEYRLHSLKGMAEALQRFSTSLP